MRILHLTDHFPPVLGGIETHVATLAARQAARGDSVTVLTSTAADADGAHCDDHGPVEVVRAASYAEARTVDVSSYDLVHAHVSVVAPFSAPLAARFARAGVPTLVTVHSMWNGLGPVPGAAARLAGLRGAPVSWSAVSTVAATEVARRVPRDSVVHLLPNAVSVPPRPHTPAGDRTVRIVSTMRVARRKRPVPLIEMFGELARRVDVPVELLVIGDGPLRTTVERRARQVGVRDRVTVTGRVAPEEVVAHLAAADVYVAPAILESFGLAALEARSVGLPVVGFAASGLRDFVRPGVEGLLCASDTAMVGALRLLAEDRGLRHAIAEHNRTTACPLTWETALGAHDLVYADVTTRGRTVARWPR